PSIEISSCAPGLIIFTHVLSLRSISSGSFSSILVTSFRASPSACRISSSFAWMAWVSRCSALNHECHAPGCQGGYCMPLESFRLKQNPECRVDKEHEEGQRVGGVNAEPR